MDHEIVATWIRAAQVFVTPGIGLGQIGMIGWGLGRMRLAAEERNRQLDIMEANQREQGQAVRDIGQALERQGAAMTQAFTQQGQALDRQGEFLAELRRRTA